MNYTEKYHLPQWEETDRIMRTDFNKMCADIDAGLGRAVADAAAATAAAKQEAASATAGVSASAAQAQSTADAALAKANAAYAPDQPPYVVGQYTGDGNSQHITLGFRPRFVIIAGCLGANQYQYTRAAGGQGGGSVSFSSNGFSVGRNGSLAPSNNETPPKLVESGVVYSYIAFR